MDDVESVCKALQRLRRPVGARAEALAARAECLQSLADLKPGCIVLDVHVPGMTGFDEQAQRDANHHVTGDAPA